MRLLLSKSGSLCLKHCTPAWDRQGSPSSLGSSPEGTFGFEMLKFMQARPALAALWLRCLQKPPKLLRYLRAHWQASRAYLEPSLWMGNVLPGLPSVCSAGSKHKCLELRT